MTGQLPTPEDAAQLHKLRALRVTRSRERFTSAKNELSGAAAVARQRQQSIEDSRCAIESLARSVVTNLVPHLPRWHGMIFAQGARLAERLEREEDAMIVEARRLDEAGQAAEQARTELSRAIAREDVVRELAQQARHAQVHAAEQQSEIESEDQGCAARSRQETRR